MRTLDSSHDAPVDSRGRLPADPGGRSVLVTGATSGIGAATASLLARRGYLVLAGYRSPEDAEGLRALGAHPVRLDVAESKSISAARSIVSEALDGRPLWALVNNAGISDYGPVELTPPEAVREILEVNLVGAWAVTRAFLPELREAGGRIVNISSTSGRLALPYMGAYTASKHALEAFSDSLRREVQPLGVSVTVIQPGRTKTPMLDAAPIDGADRYADTPYERGTSQLAARARNQPEALEPERIAQLVERTLRDPRPPTRMTLVPGSRWKFRLATMLPDRLVDWLLARR